MPQPDRHAVSTVLFWLFSLSTSSYRALQQAVPLTKPFRLCLPSFAPHVVLSCLLVLVLHAVLNVVSQIYLTASIPRTLRYCFYSRITVRYTSANIRVHFVRAHVKSFRVHVELNDVRTPWPVLQHQLSKVSIWRSEGLEDAVHFGLPPTLPPVLTSNNRLLERTTRNFENSERFSK